MSHVEPPRASPQVPHDQGDHTEPITAILPATREYVRHIGWITVAKSLAAFVLAVFLAGVFTWDKIKSVAAAEAAEKVEPVKDEVKQLRDDAKATKAEVQEQAKHIYRTEAVVELLARDRGLEKQLPPPVPPTKDGGP